MKRALVAIPPVEEYPWQAVQSGLRCLDYRSDIMNSATLRQWKDYDLLVTWSPWDGSRRQAVAWQFKAAGKPVLVMENGWLTIPRGHTWPGIEMHEGWYQVAFDGWNGTGTYWAGDERRWRSWGKMPRPWQSGGRHALVIGQRGHPSDRRTAPPGWHEQVVIGNHIARLERPRNCARSLIADIEGAAEVHVWSSNVASLALLMGVRVIQHGPNLMVSELATKPGEGRNFTDRESVFEKLSGAQWHLGEVTVGEPFTRLLAHV